MVVGVNSNDDIWYREGINSDKPTGTDWKKVNGKLMNIDIEDEEVVGTNSGHAIFRFQQQRLPQYNDQNIDRILINLRN